MTAPPTALLISAHAADFVWRCGGSIALHAAKGRDVTVLSASPSASAARTHGSGGRARRCSE